MWESKKEAEAERKFTLAMEAYQKASSPYQETAGSELKNALAKFEEVNKEYPRTAAGRLSVLYKGNVCLRLGDFEEALKAYQTFLDKAGAETLYRLFALQGLGYALEGKKEYTKAIEAYQQIINLGDTFQQGEAYLSLGRCYEKLGKNAQALESYRAYLKVTKESEMTHAVLRKISLLEK
jgi:tetratricopeptide (TPR) repeat protein